MLVVTVFRDRVMPLSMRTTDLMLYFWTYNRHKGRGVLASSMLYGILNSDLDGVADFLQRYVSAGDDDVSHHLAEQISYMLRDEPIHRADALHVANSCCVLLVKGEDAGIFPTVEIVRQYEIIPSLILCGRRQACSQGQEDVDSCLLLILQAIW